ncbi:MAG: STAS domain-containing protein, partial [Porticoccaceae bacterium]
VSILDSGGVSELYKFIESCRRAGTTVYLADLQFQPMKTLSKAGFKPDGFSCRVFASLSEALAATGQVMKNTDLAQ